MRLNAQVFEKMRLSNLEDQICAYLNTLDSSRFSLLGADRTLEVAKIVIRYGDHAELAYVENYQYVAFMAYFMGSYFHEDHRYDAIHQWLVYKGTTPNDRVNEAHLIFKAGAERFIGNNFHLMKAALLEFQGLVNQSADKQISDESIFVYFCQSYRLSADEIAFFNFAKLQKTAHESAHVLNVATPLGYATCLSLTLWLGSGFFKDPMFPWVSDICQRDYPNAATRAQALFDYANKRLVRLLQKENA